MDWLRRKITPVGLHENQQQHEQRKANERWLLEEEQRQLRDMRERLDRIELQLNTIVQKRGS